MGESFQDYSTCTEINNGAQWKCVCLNEFYEGKLILLGEITLVTISDIQG